MGASHGLGPRVAVEPRARWERLYRLVTHVLDHHGDRDDPQLHSGTDLFGLAQSIAERTKGTGGVILLDRSGRVGFAHNTARMAYGYVAPDGSFVTSV